MIIDELVARIGFTVTGLKNLFVAKKAMDGLTKSVAASNNPLKGNYKASTDAAAATAKWALRIAALQKALSGLRFVGGKAFSGIKIALAEIIKLLAVATARSAKLGVTLAAAVGGVKLTAALAGIAAVLSSVAGAVRGRREQINAADSETTKGRRQALSNVLTPITGLQGDRFADEITSSVGSKLLDVRKGGEKRDEAIQAFAKYGISLTDKKTGLARDSTPVAMDLIRKSIALRNERDGAKTNKQKIAADRKLAGLDELGISSGFVEALSSIKDDADFLRRFMETQKDNPPQKPEQKTKEQALSEEMAKLAGAAGTLRREIGTTLTDAIKEFGPSMRDMTSAVQSATESFKVFAKSLADFFKAPEEKVKEKLGGLKQELDRAHNERAAADPDAKANPIMNAVAKMLGDKSYRPPEVGSVKKVARDPSVKEPGWVSTLREWKILPPLWITELKESKADLSKNKSTASEQKVSETNNDNRKYEDIGTDKRVITTTVTVNATGLDGIVGAIKNGIASAISKAGNTSTAITGSP